MTLRDNQVVRLLVRLQVRFLNWVSEAADVLVMMCRYCSVFALVVIALKLLLLGPPHGPRAAAPTPGRGGGDSRVPLSPLDCVPPPLFSPISRLTS